jgi:hypothetical protein
MEIKPDGTYKVTEGDRVILQAEPRTGTEATLVIREDVNLTIREAP